MTSQYLQVGDVVDYTCPGTVAVGAEIVLGTNSPASLGVALKAGVAGDVIPLAICGTFTMPKLSGAVIAQGESVDWDVSLGVVDDNQMTPAAGDLSNFGIAVKAAASGTNFVEVRLNPGNAIKA